MLPFKKILCPTDFSDPSYEALKSAVELAQHFSAKIFLVHIVAPVPGFGSPRHEGPVSLDVPAYQEALANNARESLRTIADARIPKEIETDLRVVVGPPAEKIIRIAEEEEVDAIVIATHGISGWQRFMFGSVTERVVRHASCPVLSLRQHHEKS